MYSNGVRILIWMCAIFYLLQHLYFPITHEWFGMAYVGHPNFKPMQLLTYGFLHGDAVHIFVNMLMLAVFGTKVEHRFGIKNFFALFAIATISGGVAQQISQGLMIHEAFGTYFPKPPLDMYQSIQYSVEYGAEALRTYHRLTVGASAGVFGVMLAFTCLFPNQRLGLPFLKTTMSARLLIIIYVIGELYMFFYKTNTNIAHIAHLAGALCGLLIALLWKRNLTKNNA